MRYLSFVCYICAFLTFVFVHVQTFFTFESICLTILHDFNFLLSIRQYKASTTCQFSHFNVGKHCIPGFLISVLCLVQHNLHSIDWTYYNKLNGLNLLFEYKLIECKQEVKMVSSSCQKHHRKTPQIIIFRCSIYKSLHLVLYFIVAWPWIKIIRIRGVCLPFISQCVSTKPLKTNEQKSKTWL